MDLTPVLIAVVPLAVGVTKTVDLIRNAFDANDTVPQVVWNIVAFAIGVVVAIAWQIDLAAQAGLHVTGLAGQILTGLVIGGAAGFWHEPLDAWSAKGHNPHARP